MVQIYKIYAPPLSLNMMYPTAKHGRRVLSTEGRNFKKLIKDMLFVQDLDRGKPEYNYYQISIIILYPELSESRKLPAMFFKNGRIRPNDCSNMIKPIEDALFEYLGPDDSNDISVHCTKRIVDDDITSFYILVGEGNPRDKTIVTPLGIFTMDSLLEYKVP